MTEKQANSTSSGAGKERDGEATTGSNRRSSLTTRSGSFNANRQKPPTGIGARAKTDPKAIAEQAKTTAAEGEKKAPPSRRPSLAEARAAAKAAAAASASAAVTPKTAAEEDEEVKADVPVTAVAPEAVAVKGDEQRDAPSAQSSESVATVSPNDAAKPSAAEAQESKTAAEVATAESTATAVEDKSAVESKEPPVNAVVEKRPPAASASRRPSLAEARAAAKAAAAAKQAATNAPTEADPTPSDGSSSSAGAVANEVKKPAAASRRPSLAETRAAAKAAAAAAKKQPTATATPTAASPSPSPSAPDAAVQERLTALKTLLTKALASGVAVQQSFDHFDKDGNGRLSYAEFALGLKELGGDFEKITESDAMEMAKALDREQQGSIQVQDLKAFIQDQAPQPKSDATTSETAKPPPAEKETTTSPVDIAKPAPSASSSTVPPTRRAVPARTVAVSKPPPLAQRRASTARNVTTPATTTAAEKTATATTTVATSSFAAGASSHASASVSTSSPSPAVASAGATAPSTDAQSAAPSSDRRELSGDAYECSYDFHSDPEIRSVEVKLRKAALDAYARGVFPLRLVHKFLESRSDAKTRKPNANATAELLRVEFLQILMELGFSLLPASHDDDDDYQQSDDSSKALQFPRLNDHLYARQLERLARYKHHIKQESKAQRSLLKAVKHHHHQHQQQQQQHKASSSTQRFVQEKSQLLRVLSYYRDGHKKSLVYSLLRDQVTTRVPLFPSFGELLFLELPLANPYAHQERFRLEWLSPPVPATIEVEIVTRSDEWQFYRETLPLAFGFKRPEPVERDMIDAQHELVLDPNEQVPVPVRLRWLHASTISSSSSSSSSAPKPAASLALAAKSCTHGHTVALFQFELFPQPFVCHRVLRFVHAAASVWRWRVRCPRGRVLVCMDPSVAVEHKESEDPEHDVVTLKCRVGAYPSLEEFFVIVYDDELLSRVHELWQVRIQAALRLDVHALLGQSVRSELVIKGDDQPFARRRRLVQCVTTRHHARHVAFRPSQVFALAPDAFNRIEWRFCAVDLPAPALARVLVQLVDVEHHELVATWLLHVSLARPTISKTYELRLPRAQPAQKKIAYANPWDEPQTIVLRSSAPERLRPRDDVLQLAPLGHVFLRLVFPVVRPAQSEDERRQQQQQEQGECCCLSTTSRRRKARSVCASS
ncbi:hypothetical protein PINS_up005882 [Pythium insidiosum]|nr:hypothetical protein PINS_up005882 [Pythium insidiosum]